MSAPSDSPVKLVKPLGMTPEDLEAIERGEGSLTETLELEPPSAFELEMQLFHEREANQALQGELQTLRELVEQQVSDANERGTRESGLHDRVRALQDELDFARKEVERAHAREVTLEASVERLRDENDAILRESALMRRKYEQTTTAYESLSGELLSAQARAEELEAYAAAPRPAGPDPAAAAEIAMAQQIIVGLEHQCAAYESRIATMQHQLAVLAARVRATSR